VVHHMAVLAQAAGDVAGGLLVVLDQQNFHGRLRRRRRSATV
jgi:hypothetical protein